MAATQEVPSELRATPGRSRAQVYLALTKPRIIELLLVTTVPTMLLAERGIPSLRVSVATLIGGALAAGSANTLNCVIDRDIDAVMHRTSGRPLVTGEVTPRAATVFGLLLGALSVLVLGLLTTPLAAVLAVVAIAFYVVGYTLLLKRRTSQNIVWGGAAGCMPVLIGWSAVTGSLAWAPVVLFAVVFFWTPPHYWPLSMKFREDYAAAGVPMLPVVAADVRVAREIGAYTVAMVLSSLALGPVAGLGWSYTVPALLLGAMFGSEAWRLHRDVTRVAAQAAGRGAPVERRVAPMRLFHLSITYLTLLFVAVAVSALLPV